MSLPAGTRLGPFEIQTPLGAGGMGEVYLARDTRLDRTVAIKVLPQHVRSDSALRERFEREARTISALSHPHICTLYDIGQDGDVDFLVMEHLSGETLAQRLARGPVPWPQALDLAVQMARALDAAHRRRIVHRDLKPGNVMLVKGGPGRSGVSQAKLLDFGLARLVPPVALDAPHSTAPTMTTPIGEARQPLTAQGSILGTLQYMAPEQLEGRDADARSDIFALGATLYEMLAGRRPFEARSQAGLVAAIMEQDPPPIASVAPAAGVPPAVERIIGKCLAKDPEARWQSAGDLADALGWVMDGGGAAAPKERHGGTESRWRGAGGWVAAAALLGVLAYVVLTAGSKPAGEPVSLRRLAIEPRADQSFVGGGLAFSPDGSRLVYAAATGGKSQLYVRSLDQLEASPLPGTEEGRAPFFSPDGEWVGFFTGEGLRKVSLRGGQPVTIIRLPPVARGGTWLPDDTIVFAASQSAGLSRVPAAGGPATTVTEAGSGSDDGAHLWPQLLPGGRHLLLTVRTETAPSLDAGLIVIHSLDSGERHVLVNEGGYARYLPSGHLAFIRSGTLMVAPIDLERRRVTGTPMPLVEGVLVDELGGPHFDAARDGTLAYFEGRPVLAVSSLVMADRTGAERLILKADGFVASPKLDRDGRRVLLTVVGDGIPDIWIGDVARGTLTRFTHEPRDEFNAIWSPDGSRIFYSLFPIGVAPKLVWRPADGAAAAERVAPADTHVGQFAGSVSADGGWIAYSQALTRASSDIWVMPLDGDGVPRALVNTPFDDYGPEFSPDGRWVAYTSNESGRYEVYAIPFPGPGPRRQISHEGGTGPAWARDGTELFYVSGTTVKAVKVGPDLTIGEPRALFDKPYLSRSTEDTPREFDVHPDGRHFIMVRREAPEDAAPPRLNVVLGWTAELLRR